jgi:transcriptional regulator with XRE-family HTH domain
MADEMRRRRDAARHAFTARRGDLGLTQEQVAHRGEIVVRTVQNFEKGKWPNARTRARLERAVAWPLGEIARLAGGPAPSLPAELLEQASQLSPAARQRLKEYLESLDEDDHHQSAAAG